MARMARFAVASRDGASHHAAGRDYRQTVFFDDGDRQLYLAILQENASR